MKSLLLIFALINSLMGHENDTAPPIYITQSRDEYGQYFLTYEAGDGTVISEQGVLKPTPDGTDNVLVKQGSYKFTSPEGVPVHLRYTADEYGFHPHGNVLPVFHPDYF
ncbi:larval cuticle protein LCP-17-like [Cimex lectularius]|uniref:CPR type cuticle protein n=1 Tax=Cimex lectularius TaxID=79782 RepID=A0A8I6SE45_CIMLE|nr:larval cuticle protein LCP-17-like [Cimex lectularius]